MADVSSEAHIKVVLEGEEQLTKLQAAIASLQRGQRASIALAPAAPALRPAAPAAAPQRAAVALAARPAAAAPVAAATISGAARLGEQFGRNVLAPALKAPFQILSGAAGMAGTALFGLTGSLGLMAARFPPVALGVAALGAALTGLAVPLLQVIGGVKLLGLTFEGAQEAARESIRVRAAARRYYPGASGAELKHAEEAIETSMDAIGSLIGESAHGLQERVNKRLRDVRLGKGLAGDKELFERYGITAGQKRAFEEQVQGGKKLDLTDWTRQFIGLRERLQKQFDEAPEGSPQRAAARRKLSQFGDDTALIFGPKLSEIMQSFSSADWARLDKGIAASHKLAESHANTGQEAINLTVASTKVHTAFESLWKGIYRDVTPSITGLLESLHETLTTSGGLGESLRRLGSAVAVKSWEVLGELFKQVTGYAPSLAALIADIEKSDPKATAAAIKSFGEGIVKVGSAAVTAAEGLQSLFDVISDFLKLLPSAKPLGPPGPTGKPETDAERQARIAEEVRRMRAGIPPLQRPGAQGPAYGPYLPGTEPTPPPQPLKGLETLPLTPGGRPKLPAPYKAGVLPDWLSSGAMGLVGGIAKSWSVPGAAMAGRYAVAPETPGVLTEEDAFRQRIAREQEVRDAFGMAGYGAQASGTLLKNLVPENLPGAILKGEAAASAAPPAPALPTVQELNALRARRRRRPRVESPFGPEALPSSALAPIGYTGTPEVAAPSIAPRVGGGRYGVFTPPAAGTPTPTALPPPGAPPSIAPTAPPAAPGTVWPAPPPPAGAPPSITPTAPPAAGPPTAAGAFDRSRFQAELAANPAMAARLQTIVQGEVGHGASREKQQIQLETIFNRAAARGQTLEQVTQQYTGRGSKGYYPASTFRGGAIRGQAEYERFQSTVMKDVLAGSDVSTSVLGFPATGNASAGVAARGVASGRYNRSGRIGDETYVQQENARQLERLAASRAGQPTVVPPTAEGNRPIIVPPSIAGGGGRTTGALALDQALTLQGKHEQYNNSDIKEYLRTGGVNMDPAKTAWCAATINASLQKVGGKGTGSQVATSFLNWGQTVKGAPQYGDVLVQSRGKQAGQTGGHVGFATGRVDPKTGKYEMFSGNTSGGLPGGSVRAGYGWYSPNQVTVRRGAVAPGAPPPTATATATATQPVRQDLSSAAVPYANLSRQMGAGTGIDARKLGTEFGAAAAENFRDGVDGVKVPLDADTSRGVPPRSAPKPTGGDTATDS